MSEHSNSTLNGSKLISGVDTLLSNMLKHLLNENGLTSSGGYSWKGLYIDVPHYFMYKIKRNQCFTTMALPSELDKEMFSINKFYIRLNKLLNPIKICSNLSRVVYIHKDFVPELINDYYLERAIYNLALPTEANQTKFKVNMTLITKELNWLHENNVIMQTL